MAGAHVFPGGRVDDGITRPTVTGATGSLTRNTRCRGLMQGRARVSGGRGPRAVRGGWRPVGAQTARGEFVSLTADADRERFAGHRADLNASRRGFHDIVAGERLRLALDAFVPFAHWVTPPIDVKRFDTRFCDPNPAAPDAGARCPRGDRKPVDRAAPGDRRRDPRRAPASSPNLGDPAGAERFDSVEAALSWAATHRIERREPVVTLENGVRKSCCPETR